MIRKKLSHVTESGKADMVDVGGKPMHHRTAVATGHIKLKRSTMTLIRENQVKKGDVLRIAEIAGIQGAKQTAVLIPLCHPLPISKISVEAHLDRSGVRIQSEARCTGQTGIEMEALMAVSIALMTVYDMCKAVDKEMVVDEIRLVAKRKENVTV